MKAPLSCKTLQIARKNRDARTVKTQRGFEVMRRRDFLGAPLRLWIVGALLAVSSISTSATAMAPGVGGPKTTLVIFSDRPMAEPAWASLFAELRRLAVAAARDFPLLEPDPQLVRGIDLVPGQLMDNPIVVKLHGDCRPPSSVQAFPAGAALGWVLREEGRISPFIQVDCARVAQLVSPRMLWLKNGEKSNAMSGAIARVILHEWIHIAGQTDQHARKGISKPSFLGADLVPDLAMTARAEHTPTTGAQESKVNKKAVPGTPADSLNR